MSNADNTLRVHNDYFLSHCQLLPHESSREICTEKARYSSADLRGCGEGPAHSEATFFHFHAAMQKIGWYPLESKSDAITL